MLTFIMISPGTTGTEEPPGITALILRPFQMPPAISSRSANGMPSGTSKLPGLLTWPETEKIFVPPEFFGPSVGKPLRTLAQDGRHRGDSSGVLLIVVGAPYRPKAAGNGGLKRGLPFLPSSESSSAVSSPQM